VVDHEINLQAKAGSVQHPGSSLQAFFGSIKSWPTRSSQIEVVIDIVADGEVTLVGPEGWWNPDKAIPSQEQIGCALLDGPIR
jgi:hypothetical protein